MSNGQRQDMGLGQGNRQLQKQISGQRVEQFLTAQPEQLEAWVQRQLGTTGLEEDDGPEADPERELPEGEEWDGDMVARADELEDAAWRDPDEPDEDDPSADEVLWGVGDLSREEGGTPGVLEALDELSLTGVLPDDAPEVLR